MSNNKVIVMTAWRRPRYFGKVLASLSRCWGIEKYEVILCLDGPSESHPEYQPDIRQVQIVADLWKHEKKVILPAPNNLGCTDNTRRALLMGFEQSDYVILVEDDILLAPDALRYFERMRQAYENDPQVMTIGAYNKNEALPEDYYRIHRHNWFTPWGWATWRDRWEKYIHPTFQYREASWDSIVGKYGLGDRMEIYPALARSQNIGAEAGTHVPDAAWHQANHYNEHWAGRPGLMLDGKANWQER